MLKDLESVKWYLWHGNVFQALNELQGLEMDGATFEANRETARKLLKGIEELHTYVERNQEFIPNYGERYRNGERIASGLRRVSGQSGYEQTDGEAPADAVEPAWSPSLATDPDAGAQ